MFITDYELIKYYYEWQIDVVGNWEWTHKTSCRWDKSLINNK